MDIQLILVIAIFAGALFYLARMIYFSIKPGKKKGACKSCCGCDTLSNLEKPASSRD
ncbi:FeoB-associated Cys-rich membrane protein [Albibacterium indicum]|uniref:FeoB-associated Cys-rich membrane protein n=1 Tax=Albibacterium indicum TaxID=2292082 RepID=UPI000E550180|nr:FeoB-associated Cys-rich membrane protein [Pedobacter indicus]